MENFILLFLITIFCNSMISAEIDDVKCAAQLDYFKESLSARETWAINFFDAWSKLQAGIVSGSNADLGHYDQCVDFRHKSNVGEIQGQHCMIFYRATVNASSEAVNGNFSWTDIGFALRQRNSRLGRGVCVPATCSTTKVRNFAAEFLATADLAITNDYDQSIFCHTNDRHSLNTLDIVAIIIIIILVLLLISSTLYELIMTHQNKRPHELLSAFSINKNAKKLFDMRRGQSTSIIHCLPGLRTFAMLHILLGHRYGWALGFPNINTYDFFPGGKWSRTLWAAVVGIHPIAVDGFFVMSGCLLARPIFIAIEKGTFNIPKMYLHRYLRTFPLLAFLILIVLSLYKFLGDGPYHTFTLRFAQIDNCRDYYWSSLIYISNYYNPLKVCMLPSWYLSVDFQLVLLSPLIMYPAYKWGWKFLWLLPVYIISIQIWAFVAAMIHEYKPVRFLLTHPGALDSAVDFYFPTHIRMGPWLIGVILGYVFYKLKNRKISINKHFNILMWILSLGTILAILFGMYPLENYNDPSLKVAHALFFALHRNSWGLAIAWIIFGCEMGGGGIVRKFLELPLWRPLGRMSLSFYLVHSLYITVHIGSGRVPNWFNDSNLLHLYVGDILVTTFLATILYLTFEEPFLLMENFIYKEIARRKKIKTTA